MIRASFGKYKDIIHRETFYNLNKAEQRAIKEAYRKDNPGKRLDKEQDWDSIYLYMDRLQDVEFDVY